MAKTNLQHLKDIYIECFPDKSWKALEDSLNKGFCNFETIKSQATGKTQSFIIFRKIDDNEIEILDLGTKNNFRKHGLATQLFNKLFSQYTSIFLEVDENNIPAVNLYKKLGFEVISIRKNYYKHNNKFTNALNMKKNIDF